MSSLGAHGGLAVSGGAGGGGGGAGTFEDITAWDSRPAGSDGDWAIYTPTGKAYRYSSTVGDWVLPVVYDGTISQAESFDGSTTSPAGWTKNETGAGVIRQLSSPARIETDTGAVAADQANLTYNHGSTGTRAYIQGYAQVLTAPSAGGPNYHCVGVSYRNGTHAYSLEFRISSGTNRVGLIGNGITTDTLIRTVDAQTSEVWFEMLIEDDEVHVFIDHEISASLVYDGSSSWGASGVTTFIVGDATGASSGSCAWRDISTCLF